METQTDLLYALAPAVSNRFLNRELDAQSNDLIKQPLRDKVGDFFLRHHSNAGPMRLFSLPSVGWSFEDQIRYAHKPGVEFIAVEREIAILRKGLPYMPGKGRIWEKCPNTHFEYIQSDIATVFHSSTSTFFSIGDSKFGSPDLSGNQKLKWKKKYRHLTAIWLDFTGQLCREIELTLIRTLVQTSDRCLRVPVAITIMRSREQEDISNKMEALDTDRVGYVERLLNASENKERGTFYVTESVEYMSSVPMLLILGYFDLDRNYRKIYINQKRK